MRVSLESMIPSDAVIESQDIADLFKQFNAFKPGTPMHGVVKEFLEAIEEALEEMGYENIRPTYGEVGCVEVG